MLHILKVMDPIVQRDYNVLYCHTNIESENKPTLGGLSKSIHIFNRKYKKNMKRLLILHPIFLGKSSIMDDDTICQTKSLAKGILY